MNAEIEHRIRMKRKEDALSDIKMCDEERLLTSDRKKYCWDLLYPCLEWGSENSRPVLMDQSRLIVLVDKLLNDGANRRPEGI